MTVLCFQFRLSPESDRAGEIVEAGTVDELLAHVKSNQGATVILGPTVDDPEALAQRIRAADHRASVILSLPTVSKSAAAGPARSEMPTVPDALPEVPAIVQGVQGVQGETALEKELARKVEELSHLQRSQTNLLSMVAHDIRAPLGVIVGAINELSHQDVGELNDEQKFLLTLVRRSVERLTRLASNLVFLGRMESGRVELKKRRADLRAPVRTVADDIRRIDAGTSIEIVVDTPDSPVEAVVDGDRFVQVLTNLLSNAVRFAKKTVRVTFVPVGADVELTVEDDGPGVPENAIAQIFERFSRLDAPKSGTGLGLAIVRGVVDAHGGTVRVENLQHTNPKTTGARFIVRLPRE